MLPQTMGTHCNQASLVKRSVVYGKVVKSVEPKTPPTLRSFWIGDFVRCFLGCNLKVGLSTAKRRAQINCVYRGSTHVKHVNLPRLPAKKDAYPYVMQSAHSCCSQPTENRTQQHLPSRRRRLHKGTRRKWMAAMVRCSTAIRLVLPCPTKLEP